MNLFSCYTGTCSHLLSRIWLREFTMGFTYGAGDSHSPVSHDFLTWSHLLFVFDPPFLACFVHGRVLSLVCWSSSFILVYNIIALCSKCFEISDVFFRDACNSSILKYQFPYFGHKVFDVNGYCVQGRRYSPSWAHNCSPASLQLVCLHG